MDVSKSILKGNIIIDIEKYKKLIEYLEKLYNEVELDKVNIYDGYEKYRQIFNDIEE